MSPSQKPALSEPFKFGQPEKPNWKVRLAFTLFVVVAIAGIIFMIVKDPRDKRLVCRTDVPASLTGWGSCTTE